EIAPLSSWRPQIFFASDFRAPGGAVNVLDGDEARLRLCWSRTHRRQHRFKKGQCDRSSHAAKHRSARQVFLRDEHPSLLVSIAAGGISRRIINSSHLKSGTLYYANDERRKPIIGLTGVFRDRANSRHVEIFNLTAEGVSHQLLNQVLNDGIGM